MVIIQWPPNTNSLSTPTSGFKHMKEFIPIIYLKKNVPAEQNRSHTRQESNKGKVKNEQLLQTEVDVDRSGIYSAGVPTEQ